MRLVRDLGAAEDLAHDALVAALEQWPSAGVPRNPGAWLMQRPSTAPSICCAAGTRLERKHDELARELDEAMRLARRGPEDALRRRHRRRPAAPDVHRLPPGALRRRRASR